MGLISGTSADGIDAALISIDEPQQIKLLASTHHPYPTEVREQINALRGAEGDCLERLGRVEVALAGLFATAAMSVVDKARLPPMKYEPSAVMAKPSDTALGAIRGIPCSSPTVRTSLSKPGSLLSPTTGHGTWQRGAKEHHSCLHFTTRRSTAPTSTGSLST